MECTSDSSPVLLLTSHLPLFTHTLICLCPINFSLLHSFSHTTCSEADGSKEINPLVRTYVEQPRDMLVSPSVGGRGVFRSPENPRNTEKWR